MNISAANLIAGPLMADALEINDPVQINYLENE